MNIYSERKTFFLLLIILTLTTLPFLGLTDFNTKGEPREAIVAYSMIETGDWILPTNNGGEMAYKPPFFHWSIAVFSELLGGKVTEFTSRLPSTLAAITMLLSGFIFFARKNKTKVAFISTIIAFTTFEVHRAAFACRVDMVLTMCIVCALFSLYYWTENNCRRIPWLAIILMSAGTLTKGPVAIILPCGVTGAYLLMRGWNFWQALWRLTLIAIASTIIPLIWYYAAYQRGGNEFLHLVKEENIDRFTGKMSYGSHENPWFYNVITVIAGLVPWTLALVISLFSLKYTKPSSRPTTWFKTKWNKLRNMEPARLFSFLAIVIIFIFYCIPKSKRSVYLLPIYPFMAYFIAEYVIWLMKKHANNIKLFGHIIFGISIALVLAFLIIKCNVIPESIFKGKHATENIAFLDGLKQLPFLGLGAAALFPLVGALLWFRKKNITTLIIMPLCIYLALDIAFQPAILNTKSDKEIALQIKAIYPEGKIDSYVKTGMMHFFTINFYNNNRIGVFNPDKATEGYILIGDKESEEFISENNKFKFELIYQSNKRSCDVKQLVQMYKYSLK